MISVLVPSMNSGAFVGRAIESVLSQQLPDVELVIQDGGSQDATQEIVASYDDPRIRLVVEDDEGQADALNRALRRARGDWVMWLNADDELAPGSLAALTAKLNGSHDFVYGDFALIDARGSITKTYETPDFSFARVRARGSYIFSGAMLVRRDVFERVGGFDPRFSYCMDYEFLCRAARVVRPLYVRRVVAYLREHADTKTRRRPWGFWRERWVIARAYGTPLWATILGQAEFAGYLVTSPFRRSRFWRRLRPRKRL